MFSLALLLYIVAFVIAVLATIGVNIPKVNMIALVLALILLAQLLAAFVNVSHSLL